MSLVQWSRNQKDKNHSRAETQRRKEKQQKRFHCEESEMHENR